MLRLSMITLGVRDVAAATAFYEGFGLARSPASQESVSFFQIGHGVLSLFGREALAEDANAGDVWSGAGGVTLAYNLPDEAGVDEVMARAEAVGARILKRPQKAFWGGYHGYFADPDGHVWEIAYNPFMPVDETGAVTLP
ncbi:MULTISPECIES: VOC family protein [Rhodomicrobium]|uniref:VOC family protein n=1 Tax=Rhodomicrobium TaxID=1068 RepID=UPI000B4B153A|nr:MULTISPECIES: VOC family protein [Rhodomicrobium]